MRLLKLSLSNIRSYKNGEIDFPLGSTLLAGDVGAGKTTLLLAIEYALFGIQPGQRGSLLLANGESEGRIALELEINGANVSIERTLKRGTKIVSQEECAITVNGERHELAVTELKTRILELLNYPDEFVKKTNLLYKYTVYSPQEEMKAIILEDSEIRLNILRNIFGIEKYRRVKENISLVTIKLREQARVLQAQTKDVESYNDKIRSVETSLETKALEILKLEKEIFEKKELRKKRELELNELNAKVSDSLTLEKELEKANVQYSNKAMALSELESDLLKSQRIITEKPHTFDESIYKQTLLNITIEKKNIEETQKEIIEVSSKVKSLELKKEEDFGKRKRIFDIDICPTCLQDVSENHKHNIMNETETQINNAERERKELELVMHNKKLAWEKSKSNLSALESKKSELELARARAETLTHTSNRIEELEKYRLAIKNDIHFLNDHITSIKKSLLEYGKFKTQASLKERELKNAFSEEKVSEIRHAEGKKEYEFLTRELKRISGELGEKRALLKKANELTALENWLVGPFTDLISLIERRVLLRVREEFSRLFNKWFNLLTTDAFVVRLDETFSPIIMQREFELDYAFLSGGERTAIALAYRLALNQILNSMHSNIQTKDLIILDEPTDGFSEQQLEKIRDIFREINVAQLIIVSHEPKMEGFVDNVIKIKKEAGYSSAKD